MPTTDGLVPIQTTCACPSGKRRPPIRLAQGMVLSLNGSDPQKLLLTYRCNDCGTVVLVRARHVVDKFSAIA